MTNNQVLLHVYVIFRCDEHNFMYDFFFSFPVWIESFVHVQFNELDQMTNDQVLLSRKNLSELVGDLDLRPHERKGSTYHCDTMTYILEQISQNTFLVITLKKSKTSPFILTTSQTFMLKITNIFHPYITRNTDQHFRVK